LNAFFVSPWRDVRAGLDRLLAAGSAGRRFTLVAIGMAAGWWLYVPAHELLHAAGCALTGGTIDRLEIAPEYGGRVLDDLFPFVVAGGEYAGRLSGFDTGGSDLRYLATDLAPFVVTLFPGVWLLRRSARRQRALLWGFALPLALAPFLSLTGDAYEIGSIVATNLPAWSAPPELRAAVRGDDIARVWSARPADSGFLSGFTLAAALGLAWAFATYAVASWLAARLNEPPAPAPGAGRPGA
jgi:hypothetical protein